MEFSPSGFAWMKADLFTEVNIHDYYLAIVAQGTVRTEGATAIAFTRLTCCTRIGSVNWFSFTCTCSISSQKESLENKFLQKASLKTNLRLACPKQRVLWKSVVHTSLEIFHYVPGTAIGRGTISWCFVLGGGCSGQNYWHLLGRCYLE